MEQPVILEKKAVENAIILLQEGIFPNTTVKTVITVLQQLGAAKPYNAPAPVQPVPLRPVEE